MKYAVCDEYAKSGWAELIAESLLMLLLLLPSLKQFGMRICPEIFQIWRSLARLAHCSSASG
jgi:hypothetical protein